MRGERLDDLVDKLRAEIGHSTNPAVSVNAKDYLQQVLRRTQDRLWEEYDWSFLKVSRDITINTGQRYYSVPDDLPYDRIVEVSFKYGDYWRKLCHGIDEVNYSLWDSDRGIGTWPIQRWDVAEDTGAIDDIGVIEVWPVPTRGTSEYDGAVRVTGFRKIAPLVDGSSKAELDGTLIVLFAAAEIQQRQNQADAQLKLQMAQRLLARLQNQTSNKKKYTSFGGESVTCEDGVFRPREITSVTSLGGSGGGGTPANCDGYIPLTGTVEGRPVTGNIEFAGQAAGLDWGTHAMVPIDEGAFAGSFIFINDHTIPGPVAGEARSWIFSMSDGIDVRTGGFNAIGIVTAGRADIPAGSPDTTLITKGYLEQVIPGGGYIPLGGTVEGAPVTGTVKFADGEGISFADQWAMASYAPNTGLDGVLAFINDNTIYESNPELGTPTTDVRAVAISVWDGSQTYVSSFFQDGTVQAGRPDIPQDAPGTTLITKSFFEGVIPPDGQYIPLSGTTDGAPVTGNIEFVDGTALEFGGQHYIVQFTEAAFDGTLSLTNHNSLLDATGGTPDDTEFGFSVQTWDGAETRPGGMHSSGMWYAGRPDLGPYAQDSTLITRFYFEQEAGDNGPFVALEGTKDGEPVTGVITLGPPTADGPAISYNDQFIQWINPAFPDVLAFTPDSQFFGTISPRSYAFGVYDGSVNRTISMRSDGMVIAGQAEVPVNAPDATLITKAFFNEEAGEFGPFIPLEGTLRSGKVTGTVTFEGDHGVGFNDRFVITNLSSSNQVLNYAIDQDFGVGSGARQHQFSVTNGQTIRRITMTSEGDVRAGRADIGTDPVDQTLVPYGWLRDQLEDLDYIPLSGTEANAPVTGSVEFAVNQGVVLGGTYVAYVGDFAPGTLLLAPDTSFGSGNGLRGVSVDVYDGTTGYTGGFRFDGTVFAGRADIPADAPDNTLITKAFIDDNVGEGPFIPMDGTPAGDDVTGNIMMGDGAGVGFNGQWVVYGQSGLGGQLLFDNDLSLSNVNGNRGISVRTRYGNANYNSGFVADGTLVAGRSDLGVNPTDATLTPRGWVNANFAAANHTHNNYMTTNSAQTVTGQKTFNARTIHNGGVYVGDGDSVDLARGYIQIGTYLATYYFAAVFNNGGINGPTVGSITTNGTSTSYNSSSDQRLKRNICDISDDYALELLNQISARSFNWEAGGAQGYGFIAQEVQPHLPDVVNGVDPESDLLGMDYGKLTPYLWAQNKAQQRKIDELEQRLAALEARL